MKTIIIIIILVGFFALKGNSQLYLTRNGFVGFYSKTPFEDIIAENSQVYAVIDVSKKTIAFSMLLRGFRFKKELMQEHFNEDYAESDKYPKATFTGSFTSEADLSKNGTYTIDVKGTLTLHGVSKPFAAPATIIVEDKGLNAASSFNLLPQDYNISIPSLVKDKIAKQIHVEIKTMLLQ